MEFPRPCDRFPVIWCRIIGWILKNRHECHWPAFKVKEETITTVYRTFNRFFFLMPEICHASCFKFNLHWFGSWVVFGCRQFKSKAFCRQYFPSTSFSVLWQRTEKNPLVCVIVQVLLAFSLERSYCFLNISFGRCDALVPAFLKLISYWLIYTSISKWLKSNITSSVILLMSFQTWMTLFFEDKRTWTKSSEAI